MRTHLMTTVFCFFAVSVFGQTLAFHGESSSQLVNITNKRQHVTFPLTDSTRYKFRKPELALLYSLLLPGGGQFYNGQKKKGVILLSSAAIGVALILTSFGGVDTGTFSELIVVNEANFIIGIGLAYGAWFYSWIDAPMVAHKLNRRHGITLELSPTLQQQSDYLTSKNRMAFGPKLTLSF